MSGCYEVHRTHINNIQTHSNTGNKAEQERNLSLVRLNIKSQEERRPRLHRVKVRTATLTLTAAHDDVQVAWMWRHKMKHNAESTWKGKTNFSHR